MKLSILGRILLIGLVMFMIECNTQSDIKSPNQKLMEALDFRLERKDFQSAYGATSNPYEEVGVSIAAFHREISQENKVNYKTNLKRASESDRVAAASLFPFQKISSEKRNWGIEPNRLKAVHSKIQEFYQKKGYQFDKSRFLAINDKLKTFTRDEAGVNDLLENAFKENHTSELQNNIIKKTLLHISKAKTTEEALSINATVEHEVLNSKIDDKDKGLILSVNSIIRNMIKNSSDSLPTEGSPNQVFKKTASVVVIIALVAIVAAAGYIVGGIVGTASCCAFQGNCTWDCISPYARDGALAALAAEFIYR